MARGNQSTGKSWVLQLAGLVFSAGLIGLAGVFIQKSLAPEITQTWLIIQGCSLAIFGWWASSRFGNGAKSAKRFPAELGEISNYVSQGTNEVASAAHHVSERTQHQAGSIGQISNGLMEMVTALSGCGGQAFDANKLATSNLSRAEGGVLAMERMSKAIIMTSNILQVKQLVS